MNEVLAGGFTSRLFGKIRTELGLAYSVFGSVNSNWTRVAPFQMQMSNRADATVRAIEALIGEARLLATTKPATEAELKLAKDAILNSFVFNNDSAEEVLGQQLAFEYYGQPLDWLDRYRAAVDKVTAADVARVAAKYIHPDRFSIVVVGPGEGRDKPLSTLGTVKPIDLTIPPPPASGGASAGPSAAGGRAGAPAGSAGAAGAPSEDAKAKGQALVAKAVDGFGGAAAVDGLKTYVGTGQVVAKTPQGEITLESKETFALPDRFRQDMTLPFGQMAIVVAGADAWMQSPQGEQTMPSSMRGQIEEQLSSTPLLLLRRRAEPGFDAVAAGEGKTGEVTTALVAITLKGRTTTLGVDPATGRVLSAAFRGAGPDGTPGDILQTFSDFRPASGLTLPYRPGEPAQRRAQRHRDAQLGRDQRAGAGRALDAEDPQAVMPSGSAKASSQPAVGVEPAPDLSVVVVLPAGVPPSPGVVPALTAAVETFGCSSEVVIVAPPRAADAARAAWPTAAVLTAPGDGYGVALAHALQVCRGEWILLVDADLREPGPAAAALWAARPRGEVLIGSRFVDGATARMPALRRGLSRALNRVFKRGLSLGVRDLSSATRLVRRKTLAARYDARGFDILQELLVRAYADGWRVVEVPIAYEPAHPEAAYPRAVGVGADYLRRFWALWKLRNSILAADYDDRAHDSAIPLQRYWQRQRFKHITELVDGEGRVLDVGCGSSRIIGALVPAASASTCCGASCATRAASAAPWCTDPGSRCRCRTRASPASCARR